MFKTIRNLIVVAIIFGLIIVCFFLFINKTFIYEVYVGDLMEGDGIPLNRFTYLFNEDSGLNTRFISPLKMADLNAKKESYLNSLELCFGRYYYDSKNDITITKYNIIDNKYYRDIYISYASGNYCSEDFILDDKWIDEVLMSVFNGGDITKESMEKLIAKIKDSKRIENPIISDYNNDVSLKLEFSLDSLDYIVVFEDFDEDKIVVKKTERGITQIAVYEVNDAVKFLNSLEKSV